MAHGFMINSFSGWFVGTCANTTVGASANLLLFIHGASAGTIHGELGLSGDLDAAAGASVAVGSLLGNFAATGAAGLAISLALSLTAGIVVRRWLSTRSAAPSSPNALPKPNSDESWRLHVLHSSSELRDRLDESALALLRAAYPRPA